MSDFDKARQLFENAGLSIPKIPSTLRAKLRERRQWSFSTREIVIWPYNLHEYVDELNEADYALLAHSGHGANSYAVQYYLVFGPLRLFFHLGWGGVYSDADADAADVRECFTLADEIVAKLPEAMKKWPTGHLTIVASTFYGSFWAKPDESAHAHFFVDPEADLGERLSIPEARRSRRPAEVLADVLAWLGN